MTTAQLPRGPQYIDTKSCRCALEEPQTTSQQWRCIGDSSANIYKGTTGKWYHPTTQTTSQLTPQNVNGGIPPDTSKTFLLQNNVFVPLDAAGNATLSYQDQVCTGINDTQQSSGYYGELAIIASGGTPQLCAQVGAIPIPLQSASSWHDVGCLPGFFCPNNTITRLPQFCPPPVLCNDARLAGDHCFPAMGPLEPQPCKEGYYCPPGGLQQNLCPAGSFCPFGSVAPQPCTAMSWCAAGSVNNVTVYPVVALAIIDAALLVIVFGGLVAKWVRNKTRTKRHQGAKGLSRSKTFSERYLREQPYEEIQDDQDVEMAPMEATIKSLTRAPTGFEIALAAENFRYSTMFQQDVTKDQRDLQLFVQSLSKCLGANKFGLSFGFENLVFQPKKSPKPILSGVTGMIHSGSLWGVMGASGAGKSTFVNVLMGKTAHTGGITRVNGVEGRMAKYKKIIGYVPQDDIVSPELTVRENILHSARIRLPSTWPDKDIQTHVDTLISCLQLSHITNSLVGSTAAPVISGGQRKRVSIGMELAAAPMAIFLDEPTSGLDATSASSIMTTLKAISRLGITIITIIHQPRREIFESLDSLLLLGQGQMIYQGQQKDVVTYFEGLGFHFPEYDNPADIVTDIIAGQGQQYKEYGDSRVKFVIDSWQDTHAGPGIPDPDGAVSHQETAALQTSLKTRGAYWYTQIYYCFLRSILQQYRLRGSFYFEIGVAVISGGLIGLSQMSQKGANFRSFFNPPYDILSSSLDFETVPQMGLLIAVGVGVTASAPGVKLFGEEKLLYRREAAAGHNRFAYYIGKVVSVLPRMALANLHFTTIFLLLTTPIMPYSHAFAANFLYFYCIYGLTSCVSMMVNREDGPLLGTILSLIVGVLNGASPSMKDAAAANMSWFFRICPGTYLTEAYFTDNISPLRYLYQIDLAAQQIGYSLDKFPTDIVLLIVLGTVYRVIAFGLLRFFNRR